MYIARFARCSRTSYALFRTAVLSTVHVQFVHQKKTSKIVNLLCGAGHLGTLSPGPRRPLPPVVRYLLDDAVPALLRGTRDMLVERRRGIGALGTPVETLLETLLKTLLGQAVFDSSDVIQLV